jgi:hypothetical protein
LGGRVLLLLVVVSMLMLVLHPLHPDPVHSDGAECFMTAISKLLGALQRVWLSSAHAAVLSTTQQYKYKCSGPQTGLMLQLFDGDIRLNRI